MTMVAYRSTHPEVLRVWHDSCRQYEAFVQHMQTSQDQLGRRIFTRQDPIERRQHIVGLEHRPELGVPDGWRLWHRRHFLRPQPGPVGENARAWLADHQPPATPEDRLSRFGVATHIVRDDRVYWPGIEELDDGLYITWGVDTGWDGSGYFTRVPLSSYYAAQERAASSDQAG